MLLEGRIDSGEIGKYAEKDANSASTFSIAACLGDVDDLTQKWKSLADKDIPSGVLMLEESRFKVEIVEAMKRLAVETRRLAGVLEPITIEPVASNVIPLADHVSNPASQVNLFDLADEEQTDSVNALAPVQEPVKSITVGEMRAQMGMVIKAKKREKIGNDQILLFAL